MHWLTGKGKVGIVSKMGKVVFLYLVKFTHLTYNTQRTHLTLSLV